MAPPRLSIVIGLSIFLLASHSYAQEKFRIAYAGGASVVPLWIVAERGLLKKQNVQAEMIQINASPAALQAMLAGEVDVNVASVTTLVSSRLAGADVVMLMAIVPTFPNYLIVGKSVSSVQELKGKTGGINRFGAVTDLGMRLVLRKFGLDPEKDVRLIPVGGTSQAIAALAKGVIQFSLSNEPFVREAEKLGFKSIVDVGSLKIPFHWNGVLSREATVKSKRGLLARFVRAMTEAIHIYKTEKAWTKSVIGKYLRMDDPESLERTYNSFNGILPDAPFPTSDGVKTLLDDLAGKNPKAAEANAKEFVDASFVEELERSGFIKRLYQTQPR
jgi:ABC-type nitrate/sulfonate/bicarbonate transport system substrate-binding protein